MYHKAIRWIILQEWDQTNFLVDLSGDYATCKAVDRSDGVIDVEEKTPDGELIVAVVGSIEGSESDSASLTGYIEELIKRWMSTNAYDAHVRQSCLSSIYSVHLLSFRVVIDISANIIVQTRSVIFRRLGYMDNMTCIVMLYADQRRRSCWLQRQFRLPWSRRCCLSLCQVRMLLIH